MYRCINCKVEFETEEGLIVHLKGAPECQAKAVMEIIRRTTADMGMIGKLFCKEPGK